MFFYYDKYPYLCSIISKIEKQKMEKYTILTPGNKGTFQERLGALYLQLGAWLDTEAIDGRTLQFCKVFLSDSQNQMAELESSPLYAEILSTVRLSVVEQTPLDGSKVSLLVKTDDHDVPVLFHSIRLTEDEALDKDSYTQTRMIFDKYLQLIADADPTLTMERNCVRTWIYVSGIDVNYKGVVEARNDVFAQHGMTASTHYIASTGIGGATPVRHALVAIDFLTVPGIQETDKKYLQALDHLNPTHEYGVAFERGTRLTLPDRQKYFISGTASIDHHGQVMYEGDVVRQTGRLLENIGALLADGNATMNNICYFLIYLRDISDYPVVDRMMSRLYPSVPRIILEARVCRPGWLIEMECIASKTV